MPKLIDTRSVIEIPTTTIEGGIIKAYDGLLAGDLNGLVAVNGELNMIELVAKLICEWNLEDEEGNALPVTAENVKKL